MRTTAITRHEAHAHVLVDLAARQEAVLGVIRNSAAGATSHEVAVDLGVPLNTISGRFTELAAMGKIRAAGTRANPSGRRAAVWVEAVTEANGQGRFF